MFILLIDVDDDTRSVVFNDLSLHDRSARDITDIYSVNMDVWYCRISVACDIME